MKYLICLLLCSCASTKVYRNGLLVLNTQADASNFEFIQGDTQLRATRLNHSGPTRAGGSVLGTGLAGAAPIVSLVKGGL